MIGFITQRKFWLAGLLVTFSFIRAHANAAETNAADTNKDDTSPIVQTAIFAGGCFWCMEKPFDELDGVLSTVSGYTGGRVEAPTYKQVSSGSTGHLEVVKITFDANKISYAALLDVFWKNVDPYDDEGQFCDKGGQYLSAIFYLDDAQRAAAEQSKQALIDRRVRPQPVATKIIPASKFYEAEKYHQDYYQKNPLRYRYYRGGCKRDARLEELWGPSKSAH